jgi:hypothetical protein
MKQKIISFALALLMVLSITLMGACEPQSTSPPAGTEPATGAVVPGTVTLVKSYWSGGNLVFADLSGNVMLTMDGTNGDIEITTATITTLASGSTLTGPTITGPTITGTVGGNATYTNPTIVTFSNNGTFTMPKDTTDTIVARDTSDTLTNKTLTSPTITGTGAVTASSANFSTLGTVSGTLAITASSLTGTISGSPAFSGTPTFANQASGTVSLTGGSANWSVTHGLASAPTRVFITLAGVPGTATDAAAANGVYAGALGVTTFYIYPQITTNATVSAYWLAYIADE